MSVNDKQVGGSHYKTGDMQHWDIIDKWNIPYLYGCASKYVARAWKKGSGEEDLMKAIHYLEKAIEVKRFPTLLSAPGVVADVTKFASAAKLNQLQIRILNKMLTASNEPDLREVISDTRKLMLTGPGTPEDGGHHG